MNVFVFLKISLLFFSLNLGKKMYIQKYEGKDASISILKHKSRNSISE